MICTNNLFYLPWGIYLHFTCLELSVVSSTLRSTSMNGTALINTPRCSHLLVGLFCGVSLLTLVTFLVDLVSPAAVKVRDCRSIHGHVVMVTANGSRSRVGSVRLCRLFTFLLFTSKVVTDASR